MEQQELKGAAEIFAAMLREALLPTYPDGPTPILLSVPAADVASMVAGEPRFDEAMERSWAAGRAGVLVIPAELEWPS